MMADGAKLKVLVCGGAGYIGSHLVREITKDPQYQVVVLDNLSKGAKTKRNKRERES